MRARDYSAAALFPLGVCVETLATTINDGVRTIMLEIFF